MRKSDHVLCLDTGDRVVVTNFCSGSHVGTAENGRSRSIVGLAGSGRPHNWIRGVENPLWKDVATRNSHMHNNLRILCSFNFQKKNCIFF